MLPTKQNSIAYSRAPSAASACIGKSHIFWGHPTGFGFREYVKMSVEKRHDIN